MWTIKQVFVGQNNVYNCVPILWIIVSSF